MEPQTENDIFIICYLVILHSQDTFKYSWLIPAVLKLTVLARDSIYVKAGHWTIHSLIACFNYSIKYAHGTDKAYRA